MSAARRLLILGGIGLALVGMIYGGWYAVFAEHQELDGIGRALTASFTAAAERHAADAQSALEQYRERKYDYDRHVDVHGHWIGLAMLLMVLGMALDRLSFSEQVKTLLAGALVLGSFLFPLGVLLETLDHGSVPRALAVAGSALVIVSLGGMMLGFVRAQTSNSS
jgi:hypothetical protein